MSDRCDDRPIVFTQLFTDEDGDELFSYNWGGERLALPFEPEKVCMCPDSGRVYHPGPEKIGGVGLVRSALAIEFSKTFTFDNGESDPPTKFRWKDKEYILTNELFIKVDQTER